MDKFKVVVVVVVVVVVTQISIVNLIYKYSILFGMDK